jgi:NifU-like protein
MAKNSLIGGTLWDNYSDKVADRMNNPRFFGELTEDDAKEKDAELIIADWGAESCGDAVRLYWLVEKNTQKIIDGKFKSFGCGTAIASSDMMIELCIGKTVDEALEITNIDVEKSLRDTPDQPAVPPQKMHCSVMAYDVIKQAAAIYKGIDKEALDEQEMVCECARITLRTIQDVIRINDLKTVEEITAYTKAGAFCKSCIRPGGHEERKYYLEDILRETRARMEMEEREKAVKPFSALSLFRKSKAVENLIDVQIRPMLKKDNGDIEIVDIQEKENKTIISIRYLGACVGCVSSKTGTFNVIEQLLQNELDPGINVIVL